ncbi:hypothetical protein COU80_01520 [Candidatus Peregrinibacteria bacterium CG10_big_fil_rev_8_21_14_0_10_55_24]|nr:MAG: hypothetical protein COU80_01520 [Candidatus Peregrinibacteria bacterium CG10_big_fil_rev_8_21_14_0_10_55_24]
MHSRSLPRWIPWLLPPLLAVAAFGITVTHGFAPADDSFLVVENLAIRGITWPHLVRVFTSYDPELYIPLTFISYQVDYLIGGLHPWIFHATNVLLHALNALCAGGLLLLCTRNRWMAVAGAALFAVHPLHTEAVAWIAGRKDLLSAFFFLLAFITYARTRGWKGYTLSLLLFLCALLSKVMALTLPAILVLYDVLLREERWGRSLKRTVPFALLSIVFFAIALSGKERIVETTGMLPTILMAGKSTVFYVEKFLLPTGLGMLYPFRSAITVMSPTFFVPLLLVLLTLMLAWRNRRSHPWLTFGILFTLMTLAPTFLNYHKGGLFFFASDRYAYLPSIGVLLILVEAVGRMRISRAVITGTTSVVIAFLLTLSLWQTTLWQDPEKHLRSVLTHYPESISARVSLAKIERERNNLQAAFDVLREGLPYGDHLKLRVAAALVYAKAGQTTEAASMLRGAMELDPMNPEPYYFLGSLEEQLGNRSTPEEHYRKAVELDPSYVVARTRLGALLLEHGDLEGALVQASEALRWNPNDADAHLLMASILEALGRTEEAQVHRDLAAEIRG